jgi:hypothetical protein
MSKADQKELEFREEVAVKGEALARLSTNKDFQEVILEGYLKQKVLDSVSLLAEPSMDKYKSKILEDIVSASGLGYYLNSIEREYDRLLNTAEAE